MEIFLFSLALTVYYGIHSLLASPKVKATLTQKFIPDNLYRLFFNFMAVSTLAGIIWLWFQIESPTLFENKIAEILGLISIISGGILVPISLNQYKLSEFIGTQQISNPKAKNTLVTTGLNRFVRHPLYFSVLLSVWGFFLFMPNYKTLAIASITTIYVYVGTKIEERKLVTIFGKDYEKYQFEVPMLIPFLK